MSDKHLYSNAVDTFVATSLEEAFAQWLYRHGPDDEETIENWAQDADESMLHINMVLGQDGKPLDFILPESAAVVEEGQGSRIYKATNAAWAEVSPLGFLCSTEY